MKPQITPIPTENNDFQYIDALRRNRTKRQREQLFFVEGVRPINQAITYQWPIEAFVYSPERPLSDWATNILHHTKAKTHYQLPLPLLEKLSDKEDSSELLALVAMPKDDLARIPLKEQWLTVVFDRPASPGNLGSLIRSCDALGADGLIITGHAVDLYDPEVIRATTGSFFAVPTVRLPSQKELTPWLKNLRKKLGQVQVVGSSAKGSKTVWQHNFKQPTLLVLGNETWGLNEGYKALCDVLVRIPISGSATSLNVASAASILLYEIERQHKQR